jgi:ABC-type branched-subunit amino acid transport system ATPase component/ABC-type branched-subunit amino acid transport system permease subunit
VTAAAVLAVAHVPGTHFQVPVEVLVLGLVTGLTYALLGVGLVLVYKSSRVLNFAHGEMGALGAGLIPVLVVRHHWNYWAALGAALAVAAAAGLVLEVAVIRKLATRSRLIVLVATIGASQLFFAISTFIPKQSLGSATFPVPFHAVVNVGSLRLTTGELIILLVVPLVTAGLVAFFRFTNLGLASRAAAENEDAAHLAGVPVRRVSMAVWTLAGLLAGISAVLVGPTQPIVTRQALGPQLLVRALGAAMVGGLVSLPQVFAGGVAIGLVEALVKWNYPTGGTFEVVLLLLIVGSLLARRGLGALARGGEGTSWSLAGALRPLEPRLARLPQVRRARAIGLGLLLLAAVVVPMPMSNAHRVLLSSIVLYALMGLSLVVLTGFAGQVSLGQFTFVAIGALVGGRMHQLGYPVWMGIVYAMAAGALVAVLVGLPSLRIRGLFLAVTTLAFAVAGQTWLYGQHWLVRVQGGLTSLEIPRWRWLGIDFQDELHYYWLCLLVLVAVALAVRRLEGTGIGRAMKAVRDNEPAAATLGVSPRRVKLTAFVLAGVIAALAGFFYGGLLVGFTDQATFDPSLSLALVALVILGGITTVTGAVLGALYVRGLAYFVGPLLPGLLGGNVTLIVAGAGLLVAVIQFPAGIAGLAFELRDRIAARLARGSPEPAVDGDGGPRPTLAPAVTGNGHGRPGPPAIQGLDVVVRFGGNTAVDGVTVTAMPGEIVGLVGPNGAGKTTLFDVLSGQLRPTAGRVLLEGVDVTGLRPEQRALLGLGRTFQQARLFDEMLLVDAFKVARERSEPSELVPSMLALPPSLAAERRKAIEADELVDLLGLRRYAGYHVAELSTGTRRLAELGCMVALGARVLLLDEPTAGIAQREVEAFRPVLREIRDHLDATLVLIEHDIPMIMGLVDRLYVLAAGRVIAEGPPQVLREDPAVIAAYLGTDERVISRSGAIR